MISSLRIAANGGNRADFMRSSPIHDGGSGARYNHRVSSCDSTPNSAGPPEFLS